MRLVVGALSLAVVLATAAAPGAVSAATGLTDLFEAAGVDGARWSVVDPLGDAQVSQTGGELRIAVPAGAHDLGSGRLDAPRLLQDVADDDLDVQVRLTSPMTSKGQMQGIVAQQDADDLVRASVHSDTDGTKLFLGAVVGGVLTKTKQVAVPGDGATHLRLVRAGDLWTLKRSADGTTWTESLSLTQPLVLQRIGPFAGNSGRNAPAHTGSFAYFAETGDVVPPPDPTDTTPPTITGISASASATTAQVGWSTDEPSGSVVRYGPELGLSAGSATLVAEHSVGLSGLTCATDYSYVVSSADASGNTATSTSRQFSTGPCGGSGGPTVSVWYGTDQTFGSPGLAQKWVNVLGRVSDPDGVASLTYRLNGGAASPLTIGPDGKRLSAAGDFNVELSAAALPAGSSTVRLTAVDTTGDESVRDVTVRMVTGAGWSLPGTVDWGGGPIGQVAQVVDGRWTASGGSVRPAETGYDRLIAAGDTTWTDYEVTVPITMNSIDTRRRRPAVGMVIGWDGHKGTGQPRAGVGYGAIGWYRQTTKDASSPFRLDLSKSSGDLVNDTTGFHLVLGRTYLWKLRMDDVGNGLAEYRLKVWDAADAEPSAWNLAATAARYPGSTVLVAHHVDATFGPMSFRPLGAS